MAQDIPVYNFPETTFVHENYPGDQLDHILSETEEVAHAVLEKYEDLEEACKDAHVLEELADLTGSLETFWRIQEKGNGQEYVQEIFRRVAEKNRARGYYLVEV